MKVVTAWFREFGENVVSAACPLPDRVRNEIAEIAERAEIELAVRMDGADTMLPRARQIPLRSGTGRITSAALTAISHESRNQ